MNKPVITVEVTSCPGRLPGESLEGYQNRLVIKGLEARIAELEAERFPTHEGCVLKLKEMERQAEVECCAKLDMEREVGRLRRALKFYANPEVYNPDSIGKIGDLTRVAVEALKPF